MAGLERFVDAQHETYAAARAELSSGAKHSHWMWFVFPQLAGLGHSSTARFYAVSGLAEAVAYLRHPVLGPRLAECTDLMLARAGATGADTILGEIDAIKFRSSMTLFEQAAIDAGLSSTAFADALSGFFAGGRDQRSLALLGKDDRG